MNAALISDERDGDQNKHYDQDDALFVLCELENSEQGFHVGVTVCDRPFDYRICRVERSEITLACG